MQLKPIDHKIYFIILISAFLINCNKIHTGSSLSQKDIKHIQDLGLLDKDEKIIKFYSALDKRTSGNFFTDKRLASYWIEKKDSLKNKRYFEYYPYITSIDTVYHAGLTYTPYMHIKSQAGWDFKVHVDGKKEEVKNFFEEALKLYEKAKAEKIKK